MFPRCPLSLKQDAAENVVDAAWPVLTPKNHLLTFPVCTSSQTAGWQGDWQCTFRFCEQPQHTPNCACSGRVTRCSGSGALSVSAVLGAREGIWELAKFRWARTLSLPGL